jgi:curved DNA-binding protein CbpA
MIRSLSIFKICKGIGQYNSSDYYAVLGLPVTANAMQIRQRYLAIAKRLHPDVYGLSAEDKLVACQYLTKLVSPAYNVLNNERERTEYSALIKLIAKRLMKQEQNIQPTSKIAQKLLSAPQEFSYERAVEVIAQRQYESLPQIMNFTSQLSELNLVYLVASEGYVKASPAAEHKKIQDDDLTVPLEEFPPRVVNPEQIKNLIKNAEDLITNKQWSTALQELREGLKLENKNSKIHALLGVIYLNQKLAGMAKISFQQALKYNPQEPIALQNLPKVLDVKPGTEEKEKKGGFFGWLGGS